MVEVNFFAFAKKPNSTKRPTGGTPIDCEIKEPFDLLNPVLILRVPDSDPIGWNYVHIAAFSRYYYITDWNYERGRWFASLSVDVLASWKNDIGNSAPYIVRSASNFNAAIIDDRYPATVQPTNAQATPVENGLAWFNAVTDGMYVVGVVAGDNNTGGAIAYYAFNRQQFDLFRNRLFENADWLNISPDEISVALQKALVNPFDYITVCHWLPINASTLGSVNLVSEIKLGWWSFAASAYRIPGNYWQQGLIWEFRAPDRPVPVGEEYGAMAWEYGSNLSRYNLIIPVFGTIPIDPTIVALQLKVHVTIYTDIVSGVANLYIRSAEDAPIKQYLSAKIAVDIPLYGRTTNPVGVISGTAQAATGAAGIVTGLAVGNAAAAGSALGTVADGIVSALSAAAPTLHSMGTQGSFSAFGVVPLLTCTYYRTVNRDPAHYGRPWCASGRAINEFSGYILCAGADPEIPATMPEKAEIVAAMNGGFFYE